MQNMVCWWTVNQRNWGGLVFTMIMGLSERQHFRMRSIGAAARWRKPDLTLFEVHIIRWVRQCWMPVINWGCWWWMNWVICGLGQRIPMTMQIIFRHIGSRMCGTWWKKTIIIHAWFCTRPEMRFRRRALKKGQNGIGGFMQKWNGWMPHAIRRTESMVWWQEMTEWAKLCARLQGWLRSSLKRCSSRMSRSVEAQMKSMGWLRLWWDRWQMRLPPVRFWKKW